MIEKWTFHKCRVGAISGGEGGREGSLYRNKANKNKTCDSRESVRIGFAE